MKSIFFLKGRMALKYGLKYLGFNKGDKLYVPSFICDVVVDELKDMKIHPIFYQIDENFNVNWKDIKKKYSSKIKGIMMVHFFGKPQNINNFKNFCKKKNIYLIEDNCHGFNGTRNTNLSGDIMITSPYKIINRIDKGGLLFIKNYKKQFNFKLSNIQKHRQTIFDFLITKIKNNKFIKKNYRYFVNRPNYESLSISKNDSKISDSVLDNKIRIDIKKFSFKKEKKLRVARFNIWKKIIKKYNLKPYFNYSEKSNYILWYLVVKVNNSETRKKIYDWGWRNNIDIVSWPSFSKEVRENDKIFKFSRKLVLFPLNKDLRNDVKEFKY